MDDRPDNVKWWKIIRRGWCERVDDRRGWMTDVGGVNGWMTDVGGVNGWMTDVGGVNGWMTDVGSVYSKYRFSSWATCTGRRASLIHREETRTVSIYGVPGVNQC